MPIEPPVLRAALIKAEAWLVFSGGMPSPEAARMGTKINGMPTLSSMRERARNQKSALAYTLVRSYIEAAMTSAPAMIRYLGCTLPDTRPTIMNIAMETSPPGDIIRPAQVAV